MEFRYHSAMMGTLGIGCNILKFSESDMELSKKMIKFYKEIRETVQNGEFYRLENSSTNDYHLFQYNGKNESLLFIFLPTTRIGHKGVKVKLKGLAEDKIYRFKLDGKEVEKSGRYLMNMGIDLRLAGDYKSDILKFTVVER